MELREAKIEELNGGEIFLAGIMNLLFFLVMLPFYICGIFYTVRPNTAIVF